ncbi:MAG TPA: cytochrome C oxidase subunit IV family protein [Tepidisphaeraceae bacterium]|jgi:cytochrome c oxidase subunit 4
MDTTTTQPHDEHALAHPVPLKLLLTVYGALLFFTFVTYAATWVELGNFNIWLALLIAVIKAGLVAMYFMHLRWDSPFNGIVLITALFFVALFVGSVILDAKEYRINYSPPVSNTTP